MTLSFHPYENYQCRICQKRRLAESVSAGHDAGDCLCRAIQRREIFADQRAGRPEKSGQNQQHAGTDAVDQFLYREQQPLLRGFAGVWFCQSAAIRQEGLGGHD